MKVGILALLLGSCVTSGKLHSLSEPRLPSQGARIVFPIPRLLWGVVTYMRKEGRSLIGFGTEQVGGRVG